MNKLIHTAIALVLFAGCGGRNGAHTSQQSYETVQEGSASGVTSTIQGPGETLPPITGTNADTTTDFALDTNAIPPGTSSQPGTLDATLGSATSYPPAVTPPVTPASPTPRPAAPVRPSRPAYTPPPATTTTQSVEPPPEQTDTAVTSTQTDTAPPPAASKPKKNDKKKDQPAPETDTDTTQTDTNPPPPPPPGR